MRRRLCSLAIAACFATADSLALPVGAQVVNGAASITQSGNVLTVTNSNGAIINWQQFNISAGNTVRFNQPSASSSVLNRVLASDPSVILGSLTSNGRVWLVNPAGIFVGPGARIDAAAFVASTLNVANADFLAKRMRFDNGFGNAGNVVNQGTITTPMGGSVYLIGSNVTNDGIITTPKGETILAAGNTVELIDSASPGVKVEITGAEGNAINLGAIAAEAGRIGIAGVVVKNSGSLNASSVVSEGGRIFLRASKKVLVEGDGKLEATGSKGGQIDVLGERVGLMDRAMLDASGATGGGKVRVGGDYQGSNPDIPNATVTYVGSQAAIKVNATKVGAGGTAIVWSDDSTRAYGRISARGGEQGGDGGFVEVSGKQSLDFRAHVDLTAPVGKGGVLLLDPQNIVLDSTTQSPPPDNTSPTPDLALADNTAATSTIQVSDVTGYSELRLQAEQDITLNSTLTMAANSSVVLEAGDDISINSNLTVSGSGTISLTADKDFSGVGGAASNSVGAITRGSAANVLSQAAGTVTLRAGSGITATVNGTSNVLDAQTSGGGIVLDHGSGTLAINANTTFGGLTLTGGTLDGSGNITVATGGSFNWSNGAITGSGTLMTQSGVTTTLMPGFAQQVALRGSRVWDNYGTVTFTPNSGTLSTFQIDDTLTGGAAVFNNKAGALFNINASFNDTHIVGVGTFNNAGELRKSLNTTVATTGFAPAFNNQTGGSVNVNSGTLRFDTGGTDAGNYTLLNSATLQFHGGPRSISGNISGTGNVTFSKPQTATAVYTLTGGYNISGTTTAALDDLGSSGDVLFNGTVTNLGSSYVQSGGITNVSFASMTAGGATGFQNLTSIAANSGNLVFANGTSFSGLTSLTRAGSGTLDMGNNSVSVTALSMTGGTLTGSGNVTVATGGSFNWSNGAITGSGTLMTQSGVTTTLMPGFAQQVALRGSRVWDNYGTVTFTPNSGTLSTFQIDDTLTGGAAVFNNKAGALFDINASFNDTHIVGVGSFNNEGELRKSLNVTAASSSFAPVFNNQAAGVVNVNSGTLALNGALTQSGSINVASTATFQKTGGFTNTTTGIISGAGTVSIGGGSNILTNNGTIRPGGANAVGTLAITGNLTNSASGAIEVELLDNSTQYDVIAASGNITFGGTIKPNDLAGYQTVSGHTYSIFTSGGTISGTPAITSNTGGTYTGAGSPTYVLTATGNGAAQFVWSGANSNFWDDALNWTSSHVPTGTELAVIDGAGVKTVEVRSTGGAQSVRGVLFGFTGGSDNLLLSGSSSLDVGLSGMTVPSSSAMTVSGGTLTASGSITTNGNFNLNSGVLNGSGIVVVNGVLSLGGATLQGTGTLISSNTSTTTLVGTPTLSGKTWNQSGTLNIGGAHRVLIYDSGVLNNLAGGVINDTTTNTWPLENNTSPATFTNSGTFNKNAGSAAAQTFNFAGFSNATGGTFSVNSGTFQLSQGAATDSGTYNIGAGATLSVTGGTRTFTNASFTGTGVLNLAGGIMDFASNTTFVTGGPTLLLTSGTLQGAGNVTIENALSLGSATLQGTGTLFSSNTSTTTLVGTPTLSGKTWNQSGTLNIGGAHRVLIYDGGVLNNLAGGIINDTTTNAWPLEGGSGTATFINSGTFNKNSGSLATQTFNFAGFTNAGGGTFNVNSGTFQVSGSSPEAGTINVASGAFFEKVGGFINTGTLTGSGTINVGGSTLTNNGTISPGVGAGNTATLSITGHLNLTGGTLNIEMGGTGAGQFDKMATTGNVTMGGTLNAAVTGGYTPVNADALPFLTMGGVASGTFTPGTIAANFSTGYNLAGNEGARMIFSNVGTRTFNNSQANLDWGTALNWTGGLPGAGDTALISGSHAVSHAYGTDSIAALTIDSGNSVDISGGSLTVSGLTTLGGGLIVSGVGSAALNGTVNGAASGQFNLSGGNLTLAAASTIASYVQSGGVLGGIGTLTISGAGSSWTGGTISLGGAGGLNVGAGNTLALSGASNKLLDAGKLTNAGTMIVSGTGNLILINGSLLTNSGVLDIQAGTVQFPGSFTNAGTLKGSGTIDVGAANTLLNSGTISPGVGAGNTATLSIVGNLDLTGGQVNIDLGGTGAGQFDKLAVSGNVTLGGTLNASLTGSYPTPVNGDAMPFLAMTGTAAGTFANTNLPGNFDAAYNLAANEASRLIYSTTGTKTFLNTASDLTWGNPINWSGGALPGAGNAALISAGFAVLHPSGNDTIAALTVNASNSLNLSGGSLTVSGATSVDGSLLVSGGTLVLNGASSVQTLGMTAGALNGSGSVSIANGFNYSGGTVGLSGALDVTHTGDLSLPAMTSLTSLLAKATGHINLTGNIGASGAGNAIVLASGKDFNNTGAHTLTAGNGRWLVYSQGPGTIAKGGLTSAFRHYASTHGSYAPGSVSESGNGFIYANAQPTLTADVSLPGSSGHIYGDAPTATYGLTLTPSALADNEDIAASFGVNLGAASFRTSVGSLLINNQLDSGGYLVVANGLSSTLGYTINSGIMPAYNVTQAPLAITANNQSKVYGDVLSFTGTEFIAGGLKNGQTVGSAALASSGSAPTASVAGGPYPIVPGAATGGSFNPMNYSLSYVAGSLAVTQRPVTANFVAQSKPYDGNTGASATGYTLTNLANGDTLSLGGAAASFDNRHAGTGKIVNYTGLTLVDGTGSASNYSVATSTIGSGSITKLASVNWTGTAGDGKWSTAGNWAGNALPDGANVAAVSLPPGGTANFDVATAPTQLASIAVGAGGSFVMAGSSLNVSGSLTTPNFNQTSGSLNGAGSLTVSQSFSRSGGSLGLAGPVNITQATGALILPYDAPLTLGAVSTAAGSITVEAIGGISTTNSLVAANGGTLTFTARSPIRIGSGGLAATSNLTLSAVTPSSGSTITLDGALTAGGSITLTAFGTIAQNANILGQNISVTSSAGDIALAGTAVSSGSSAGAINYSAIAGRISATPGNFVGAQPRLLELGGSSTNGSTTTSDLVTTITDIGEALAGKTVAAPAEPPPLATDTATGSTSRLLASGPQTTGGEPDTFGATTTATVGAGPTAGTPNPDAAVLETASDAVQALPDKAAESIAAKGEDKSEAAREKDSKKDEKKEERKNEDRKEERRLAAKKVAQCS